MPHENRHQFAFPILTCIEQSVSGDAFEKFVQPLLQEPPSLGRLQPVGIDEGVQNSDERKWNSSRRHFLFQL